MTAYAEKTIRRLAASVDIEIDGSRSFDVEIRDPRFYARVLKEGSLGLGESYMDGWWECGDLEEAFTRVLQGHLEDAVRKDWKFLLYLGASRFFNMQSRRRAFMAADRHYDLGNDVFASLLGPSMTYSNGFWKDVDTLEQAQEAKYEAICEKLGLREGMTLLDVGCGWGSFIQYAVSKYRLKKAVGITVSREQCEFAARFCQDFPVEIRLQDYRDLPPYEIFDRVVAIEILEHIGLTNYRQFMSLVHARLSKGGRFYVQTTGKDRGPHREDPWLLKYIFPNSHLPWIQEIGEASEGLFIMEEWCNDEESYEKTLRAWALNLRRDRAQLSKKYGERMVRMLHYYLSFSIALFRVKRLRSWQILFSKQT